MLNFKKQFVSYSNHGTPSGLLATVIIFFYNRDTPLCLLAFVIFFFYNHVIPSGLLDEDGTYYYELNSKCSDE